MTELHTAFIRNIPYAFQNEDLKEAIEKEFGTVINARIVTRFNRYSKSRRSAGYGFVDFEEKQALDAAVNAKTCEAGGRSLNILVAKARTIVEDNIFVAGIDQGITEENLKAHFIAFHPVDAKVVYNMESEQRRGFGFVKVATKEDRDAAIAALENSALGSINITVRIARRPFLSQEEAEKRRNRRRNARRAPRNNNNSNGNNNDNNNNQAPAATTS